MKPPMHDTDGDTTMLPLAINSPLPAWPDAASAFYAGTVLVATPLLAALGGVPTLMKLGHWAALLLGVAMLGYGCASIGRSRRAVKGIGPQPGDGAA